MGTLTMHFLNAAITFLTPLVSFNISSCSITWHLSPAEHAKLWFPTWSRTLITSIRWYSFWCELWPLNVPIFRILPLSVPMKMTGNFWLPSGPTASTKIDWNEPKRRLGAYTSGELTNPMPFSSMTNSGFFSNQLASSWFRYFGHVNGCPGWLLDEDLSVTIKSGGGHERAAPDDSFKMVQHLN